MKPVGSVSYHRHLTERLDNGTSASPVPGMAADACKLILAEQARCTLADFGCYAGSMLMRTVSLLSDELTSRIGCVGLDIDESILRSASKAAPRIAFVRCSIEQQLSFREAVDVAIVSNVMHEVYSELLLKTGDQDAARRQVGNALSHVCEALTPSGYLVIQDGLLPNEPMREVTIEVLSPSIAEDLAYFRETYHFPTAIARAGPTDFTLTAADLAAFLAKVRYVREDYWPSESRQTYQAFSETELRALLGSLGMEVLTVATRGFLPDTTRGIRIVRPGIAFPAKNITVLARRGSRV